MPWILFLATEIMLKEHITILIPTGVSVLNLFLAHTATLILNWNKCILILVLFYFCRCVLIPEFT